MLYVLKIKLEQNSNTKQKEQIMTEILVIQKKPKQPNKKNPAQNTSWRNIKRDIVWKKLLDVTNIFTMDGC